MKKKHLQFDSLWWDKKAPIYHFIGKDILYFHTIFWPAVLNAANLPTPDGVFTHGFLTINKVKMSKSRGTFITAKEYLDAYPSDALRYYFAAKLTNTIQDIDLDWDDFVAKINSDIVGKIINIGSRSAKILEKHFDNKLLLDCLKPENGTIYQQIVTTGTDIKQLYLERRFSQVIKSISKCADLCNQFIDQEEPWRQVKSDQLLEAHQCVSIAFACFNQIIGYLSPITPDIATKYANFLGMPVSWQMPLPAKLEGGFPRLFERLMKDKIKNK